MKIESKVILFALERSQGLVTLLEHRLVSDSAARRTRVFLLSVCVWVCLIHGDSSHLTALWLAQ